MKNTEIERLLKQEELKSQPCDVYRMGTKAYHILGEISRGYPDLFHASKESPDYYIGSWVTGLGYLSVLFPKKTSRELTQEEYQKFSKMRIQIGNGPAFPIHGLKPPAQPALKMEED